MIPRRARSANTPGCGDLPPHSTCRNPRRQNAPHAAYPLTHPAWYANLGKRQIKSPKVYLRDTGLLHQLLGIRTEQELLLHPKSGASWEGYVIEEVIKSSMRIALRDLALDHLTVIYPGDRPYPLANRVTVVPLAAIATGAQALDPEATH